MVDYSSPLLGDTRWHAKGGAWTTGSRNGMAYGKTLQCMKEKIRRRNDLYRFNDFDVLAN